MGLFSSKMDVYSVQNNVRELIDKLCQISQQRDQVNVYLKDAILGALKVYSKQIQKYGSTETSYKRTNEVDKLINKATKILERLPSYEEELRKITDVRNDPQSIRDHLYEIEKEMKLNKLATHDYKDTLNTVVIYYQQYDALSQSLKLNYYKQKDHKNAISVLILELFVRLPQEDISIQIVKNTDGIVKKIVKNMNALGEMLKTLDKSKLTISEAEHMKSALENIKSTAKCVYKKTKVQIEKLEEINCEDHIIDDNQEIAKCKELLTGMEKTLDEYETIIQQSTFSTEKHLIHKNTKEIQRFIKELECVPDETPEISELKNSVFSKAVELNKVLEEIENRVCKEEQVSKCKDQLDHVKKALRGYEIVIQQFSLPIEKHVISQHVKKVQELLKTLQTVADANVDISGKKKYLSDRTVEMSKSLERIEKDNNDIIEYIEKLNDVERKVREVVESSSTLEVKRQFLKKQTEIINSIDPPNNQTVVRTKINAINRIEGLSTVVTINYLNQIKKILSVHRSQAQEFGYPKGNVKYEEKKNEILSLTQSLLDVTTEDKCVETSIQTIHEKVGEVMYILEKKASDNEDVIVCLEYLKAAATETDLINESPLHPHSKMEKFNEIRRKIFSFYNSNPQVQNKKSEMLQKIQDYENVLYPSKPLKVLTTSLAKYEIYMLDFPPSIKNELDRTKIENIYSLFRKQVEEMYIQRLANCEMRQILLNRINVLSINLDDLVKENERVDHCRNHLNLLRHNAKEVEADPHLLHHKKLEAFEEYRKVAFSQKSVQNAEVLNQIREVEEIITIAVSKIKLEQVKKGLSYRKKWLEQFIFPLESRSFKEVLDAIIGMKDCVEDIPEGNPEINTAKQALLKDLYRFLKNLDDYVAYILFEKKSEDFDDSSNALNTPKEDIQFVGIIQNRAKYLEEKVKQYLENSDSVDYYEIYVNLDLLLEELQQLNCQGNEELVTATNGTMDYVKRLMVQLGN